ncbi:Disulfide oxidoreductase-like protein [Madurella fahalii]|uniref:Disulfide oxidoreductase-like protein n=1 Tax=Madurella fahalii TaxID=1157608 RepID=A0ABQ0G0P7_9PEZI
MPSPRRLRVLVYLVLAGVVTLLFFTSQARHAREADTQSLQDFYHKTVNAMNKGHGAGAGGGGGGAEAGQKIMAGHGHDHDVDADGDIDEDDVIVAKEMAERLRQAQQQAKDSANAKAPNKPDNPEDIIGVGSSASGQEKGTSDGSAKKKVLEADDEHEVETELATILKKSPVIIFSKSYCPYSKRAKGILLEKYIIEPTPHVVELDQHPLGPKIQAKLAEMTGRKTVPNVMVYGNSIGGGDEITALDNEKALAAKITSLGGTRIEVAERFVGSVPKIG